MTLADNGWSPPADPSPESAWFFGILTLAADGQVITVSRAFAAEPGTQRGEVYVWLRREAVRTSGSWAAGASVTFFSVDRENIL